VHLGAAGGRYGAEGWIGAAGSIEAWAGWKLGFLDKTPYGGISCQLTVQIRIITASDTLHCLCNVMEEQHINIFII
jgi:hypothetical protein